jgi:chemotaxis protein methyltransferase CheR
MHTTEQAQSPAPPPFGVQPISEAHYCRFRELINQRAGIYLSDSKKALLVGRLARRLHALGLDDFGDYYRRVTTDESEFIEMVDRISTNETHFFREPRQFELLRREIFPRWREDLVARRRTGHARIWSAGCSTGEEPFTLAMEMDTHLPISQGWSHEILATDISTRVLRAAESASWPIERAAEIPPSYLARYMMRGKGDNAGRMRAVPLLQRSIRFQRVNLKTVDFGGMGKFDAVFCRNVLIYFDRALKEQVTAGLISCLKPGGFLFLGHAETLMAGRHAMRVVIPTVLQKVV